MTLLTGIRKLYTFSGAARKSGLNPVEEDLSPISDAAMLVKDGTILWVGRAKEVTRVARGLGKKIAKKINLKAESVIPAFVDPHTHMVFAGDRQDEFELRHRGFSYEEIAAKGGGIMSTVRATRAASEKELLRLARQREANFLRQGVVTVEIKSGYGLDEKNETKILKVAKQLKKIRVVPTFLGAHAVPPEFSNASTYVDHLIGWLPKMRKLAGRLDIFIEKSYFSATDAEKLFTAGRKLGFQLVAHADQLTSTGAAVFASKKGAVSVDHCIRLRDEEVLELAEQTSTTCVLLPGSDFYLHLPYPPARRLLEAGVRVALGTDFNPGSCPTQDLSLIGVLARLEMKMTLPEVLVAFIFNGAHALGLQGQIGSLESGKRADFLVMNEPIESLFYQVGQHPIRSVWREGRCILDEK